MHNNSSFDQNAGMRLFYPVYIWLWKPCRGIGKIACRREHDYKWAFIYWFWCIPMRNVQTIKATEKTVFIYSLLFTSTNIMFSRHYYGLVLFALVLWETTSIAYGNRRKLDEPSDIFLKYHTAVKIFLAGYVDFEDFRWLGETNSFTHGKIFQETEDDIVLCGCLGKNEGCRKVIYERIRKSGEKMGNHETSEKCFAPTRELAKEIHYWKEKVVNCLTFMVYLSNKLIYFNLS